MMIPPICCSPSSRRWTMIRSWRGRTFMVFNSYLPSAVVQIPFRPPPAERQRHVLVVDRAVSVQRRSDGADPDTPESANTGRRREEASQSYIQYPSTLFPVSFVAVCCIAQQHVLTAAVFQR